MDFQDKKAIYLQIADYVCEQILLNEWNENEKIPSIRDLAIELEVNPNTVMRTYSFLQDKNIIEMQRGVGYFVSNRARKQALEFKKEEFLTIDLPNVFKSMDLLDIGLDDISQIYRRRIKHENK
jgi:DNA-binding transcriptional regulator YhcF (GntR family)